MSLGQLEMGFSCIHCSSVFRLIFFTFYNENDPWTQWAKEPFEINWHSPFPTFLRLSSWPSSMMGNFWDGNLELKSRWVKYEGRGQLLLRNQERWWRTRDAASDAVDETSNAVTVTRRIFLIHELIQSGSYDVFWKYPFKFDFFTIQG